MDPALEGHRRYLTALRTACARRPDAHTHQLAALDREIALAADASDSVHYRAASGDVFELTRAAWLDRARNHARVAAAVGDPWSARAAALDHARAVAARGREDWVESVVAGSAPADALRRRSADARAAFTSLLLCLLRLHATGNEVERAELREQAAGAYGALREADPGFAWSRLAEQPRYLRRTPWTDAGREAVGTWIDELVSVDEPVPAEAEPGDPVADVDARTEQWRSELDRRAPTGLGGADVPDAVASYRALAASLTGDDRASVAIRRAAEEVAAAGAAEPTVPQALARFVEEGLLVALAAAPLRARAEETLERQALWPDPLVEHHWRTLGAALADARTETEVDLISVHAEACFAVEADWNALLLGSLLAPLRAACIYGWDGGEEARAGLERAAWATHALLGLGPRRLLEVPRVGDFVARTLAPLVSGDSGPTAALEGEAGFDLLAEARTWALTVRDREAAELEDAAGLSSAFRALFDRAGIREPAAAPRSVSLWGAPIEPVDLVPALARPSRPSIPGLDAVAGAGWGL